MVGDPGRPEAGAQGSSSTGVGVRTRILGTVLVLASVGMTIAGTSFTLFERRQLLQHLDGVLLSDVRQLHLDATTAAGSSTAATPSVSDQLQTALKQHVASDGEVVIAFVDGRVRFITADPRPFAPENEPALVAAVQALPASAPTAFHQVDTSSGPVRFVAAQVHAAKDPTVGTYVVAVQLQPSLDRLAGSARLYALLSAAALAVIGLGGWIVAGRLLRPLRLLREAAQGTSHSDLSWRIPVRGRDDVSELTRSVNAMLDRLEVAFDTQQQFLDDAGHELRTPITILRGNLELLNLHDPVDLAATRTLMLDELDRMSRLVSDLIALAQSTRPDFVQLAPVNLDRLLRDVFEKSQALADRRWVLDSTIPQVVDADGHRLTQAMIQLVDNAVRHTTPEDEIAIGGVMSRGLVHLWVRDTGPGVRPEDAERIFERFARGTTSRGDGHSSGLGLSIVAGIAAGHRGWLELDPSGPPGARFTLIMPLTPRPRGWAGAQWEPMLTGLGSPL